MESVALLIDESALTGESAPVDKAVGSAVSSGTVVVRGRGRATVTATGAGSAMGRIAAMLVTAPNLTPLQRRLAGVGRMLALFAVGLCAVVPALGLWRGQPLELMIVTAITLVVAAVPESLPAVVTLSLALGARRMTTRHAVIRRLPAVETLGSVTVLATDKTGTLTEGTMVVRRLWTPQGDALVDGTGYTPHGKVHRDDHLIAGPAAPDLTQLLRAAVLCNDGSLQAPDAAGGEWTPVGDPTEVGLIAAAAKLGIDRQALRAELPRVGELPFDSIRKRMSTTHQLPAGRTRTVCKARPRQCCSPLFSTTRPS